MVLPKLRVHDNRIPLEKQQCTLKATCEAHIYAKSQKTIDTSKERLFRKETAFRYARKLLLSSNNNDPSRSDCLGELIIPFGKYCNQNFRWLLENDVGYVK